MTGRAALLALVLAVLLVSYSYPLRTWYDQHNERRQLEQEAAALRDRVQELETELELWEDPAYVASQARERLHYVMPGEEGYIVVSEEDESDEEEGPEGVPPVGEGEWHERLWNSVQAADEISEDELP
ncbi:FtsB family cell division protein [Phytoactinopolyspora halotolerans]|uniref:Septum formation initiator family protein n=1 Tax=Phytoactinopolyspora halotolerans TaxID=1981512 RepID=A0A6L9S5H4_9ACTN|nr:septum formation initiator family protein [Phytoactinopolyspora halotolerans]NED99747.1 septum formation initiator family protein [Phytoactinopolyspora halotolerans]